MSALAQYYDLLYANKAYGDEIDAVLAIYRERYGAAPATAFDIGCGTGNHSLALEARGCRVWATDSDADMLAMARVKGIGTETPPEPVDLVLAMFNVINYCAHLVELDVLLALAYRNLRPGGLFVFDSWDGVLAETDPPIAHTFEHDAGEYHVKRSAVPTVIARTEYVTVRNETAIFRHSEPTAAVEAAFSWEYTHRLWRPALIANRLMAAGFTEQEPPRHWGRRGVLYVAVK